MQTLGTRIHDADRTHKAHILHILAHGYPQGIQLGVRWLTQNNIDVFLPLRDKVHTIFFHSCAAAVINRVSGYNGLQMCEALSMIMECSVTAADATQGIIANFDLQRGVQYAPWVGNVYTWDRGLRRGIWTQEQRNNEAALRGGY